VQNPCMLTTFGPSNSTIHTQICNKYLTPDLGDMCRPELGLHFCNQTKEE